MDTETDSLSTETDSLGTETDRNGPKRTFVHTETDCLSTETDSLGTETDFCDYRNGLCGYNFVIWGVKVSSSYTASRPRGHFRQVRCRTGKD